MWRPSFRDHAHYPDNPSMLLGRKRHRGINLCAATIFLFEVTYSIDRGVACAHTIRRMGSPLVCRDA